MKVKTKKTGTNFIKLDNKEEIEAERPKHENEDVTDLEVTKRKRKLIVSGSKEAAKVRGVVYLSHVPHGFHENQMRQFFGQVSLKRIILVGRVIVA